MNPKARVGAVRSLTDVYTVVIGVAVSLSVVQLIDPREGLLSISATSVLLFVAFIATLLPFVHGALRHLDVMYFERRTNAQPGALVFDFILLFFHALAFVVLAILIKNPSHFGWTLICVLSIDVVWGVFAHFASRSALTVPAPIRWAIINAIFVVLAVALLATYDVTLDQLTAPLKVAVLLTCACVLRTVLDYLWCRDFYFPK